MVDVQKNNGIQNTGYFNVSKKRTIAEDNEFPVGKKGEDFGSIAASAFFYKVKVSRFRSPMAPVDQDWCLKHRQTVDNHLFTGPFFLKGGLAALVVGSFLDNVSTKLYLLYRNDSEAPEGLRGLSTLLATFGIIATVCAGILVIDSLYCDWLTYEYIDRCMEEERPQNDTVIESGNESKRIMVVNTGVDLPQSANPTTIAAVGAEGVRGKPFSISIPVGPLPSQALVFTGVAALLMAGAVMVVLSPVGI